MQLSNKPDKLVLPFAASGAKNTIPAASQIGIVAGKASLTDGFPPLTRTPLSAGGVPPSGLDMNGILYEMSAVIRWANAGGGYPFDSAFAADTNVGGYPKGARVLRSDGLGYWFNTTDNNTTDPEGAGAVAAGWVPDFTNGVTAVTMTGSNVTLTALEYGKPIIVISGLLTANLNLIFPSIVGNWVIINSTTGPYTITCKTNAGTGVVVVNSVQALVGDATNIYSTVNDAISLMGELIASAGGTSDALTATFSPAPRMWPNGVPFLVRAASANATATPTFTANTGSLAAKTIVKGGNLPLVAGDIAGAGHWLLMQYDATLDKVVLLNPNPANFANSGANVNITSLSALVSINGGQIAGRRNKVINGNFDVWQLGDSINITGHLQKCADRWNYDYNGTIGTLNISRYNYSIANGQPIEDGWFPRSAVRLTMSVAPTGNTFQDFSTQIESVRTLAGRQVTISFYAFNIGPAASIIVKTEQYFGGGGAPSSPVFNTSAAIPIGTSWWQRYSVTFTLADTDSKALGSNGDDTLNVILSLPINQTFDLLIGGVQIEEGAVATPFETTPYADTYAMCQRYLQTSYNDGTGPGTVTTSGSISFYPTVAADLFTIQLKAPMRTATQSVTFYNPATGAAGTWNNAGIAKSVSVNTNGSKNITAALSGATPATFVAGHYVIQDPFI